MEKKIRIELGKDIATTTGLEFQTGGGIIMQCTGITGKNGVQFRKTDGFSPDLLKGYFLHVRSTSRNEVFKITHIDTERTILYIEGDAIRIPVGRMLVIDSGEPLPLMAVRLLFGTILEKTLPSCEIEIAINRQAAQDKSSPFVMVTTRKESGLCRGFPSDHISVREQISDQGEILKPLEESEINRVLRQTYKKPGATVFIMLDNSDLNSVHEKALLNLFRAAGYHKTYASHMPYSILPILPFVGKEFAETCLKALLDRYTEGIKEKLDNDSSFSLIL